MAIPSPTLTMIISALSSQHQTSGSSGPSHSDPATSQRARPGPAELQILGLRYARAPSKTC